MMCYDALAHAYDALTGDVQYEKRAAFLCKLIRAESRIPVRMVLDLACGTGTMTCLLAGAGYEMIGVDGSTEMLAEAVAKPVPHGAQAPLYLHQRMEALDLYGTVEAAVCCLDSMNYITDIRLMRRVLKRLHLFIAPGGVFIFDINSAHKLRAMDGQIFLDERDDLYCVWRTQLERNGRICTYALDLFRRDGDAWRRSTEEHRERIWMVEELTALLEEAGFGRIRVYGDCKRRPPAEEEKRIYFTCIRE